MVGMKGNKLSAAAAAGAALICSLLKALSEGLKVVCHLALAIWSYWQQMQRADFSEHIQRFKPHGNPLNSSHFDAPNTKFAPTGYRRAPNIISQHYKQELSAKASILPKDRPIRFR